jgi:predicted PurR-regulated permease PerM
MHDKDSVDGEGANAPASEPHPHDSGLFRAQMAHYAWRVFITVLILGVAYLVWSGLNVLLLTFAGILFAVFLSSLSLWLSGWTGWAYHRSLLATILSVVLAGGGAVWLLAHRLIVQATELSQQLPESLHRVREYAEQYPWSKHLLEQAPDAAESFARTGGISRLTGFASGAVDFLMALIIILFVGVFGAAEPGIYKRGLLHLIPFRNRDRVSQALDAVVFNLRAWLVGQTALMVIMGTTAAIALALMGIPLALTLGLITGIMEMIPYLGAWVSAVPAALIALQLGPWYCGMVVLLFLALHIFEGYLIAPLVQSRALHLPPALTLVTQVLLGQLMGVLGLLIAAPLTVTVVVLIKKLYVEDALGDRTAEEPAKGKTKNKAGKKAHV